MAWSVAVARPLGALALALVLVLTTRCVAPAAPGNAPEPVPASSSTENRAATDVGAPKPPAQNLLTERLPAVLPAEFWNVFLIAGTSAGAEHVRYTLADDRITGTYLLAYQHPVGGVPIVERFQARVVLDARAPNLRVLEYAYAFSRQRIPAPNGDQAAPAPEPNVTHLVTTTGTLDWETHRLIGTRNGKRYRYRGLPDDAGTFYALPIWLIAAPRTPGWERRVTLIDESTASWVERRTDAEGAADPGDVRPRVCALRCIGLEALRIDGVTIRAWRYELVRTPEAGSRRAGDAGGKPQTRAVGALNDVLQTVWIAADTGLPVKTDFVSQATVRAPSEEKATGDLPFSFVLPGLNPPWAKTPSGGKNAQPPATDNAPASGSPSGTP